MHKFFISCPLGLEDQSIREVQQKWTLFYDSQLPTLLKIEGGIELETELELGLNLNQFLRSPNRILLRIKEQKCRDLPKLFKIITKIDWKKYLKKETASFNISCSESRLMHTGRIESTCKDGLIKYFNANKIKESIKAQYKDTSDAQVFIRIANDDLTISIDTSGELLYKRDNISFKGMAPLRNNFAYIMHEYLINECSISPDKYNLIDPMCGSGTFLHEAKNRNKIMQRDFAFEIFSKKMELSSLKEISYEKYTGFDLDDKNVQNKLDDITILKEDLFKDCYNKIEVPNICILNPPYGKKIKIRDVKTQRERSEYFFKVVNRCFEKFNSEYVAIIIPADVKLKLKPTKKLKVFNNGIWVFFNIYKAR